MNNMLSNNMVIPDPFNNSLIDCGEYGIAKPIKYWNNLDGFYWNSDNGWKLENGIISNTPELCENLLANPSFTTNTDGWSPYYCTIASVAGGQSGNCCQLTRVSDNYQIFYQQVNQGGWISYSAYNKSGTSGDEAMQLQFTYDWSYTYTVQYNSSGTWTRRVVTGFIAGPTTLFVLSKPTATPGTMLFDEISANQISTPSLFRTVQFSTPYFSTCKADWYALYGAQMGVVCNLDSRTNPQNYVLAYFIPYNNAFLEKVVNGVKTNLISSSVSYVTNGVPEIRRPSGNVYQLWYNGVQVGTDQTINDAGIIYNCSAGLFSTNENNKCSSFEFDGV